MALIKTKKPIKC